MMGRSGATDPVVRLAACVGDATGRANWWTATSQAHEATGSQRGLGVVPEGAFSLLEAPCKQPSACKSPIN
jgi:hypothetical protein